jgi:hypothetical protein
VSIIKIPSFKEANSQSNEALKLIGKAFSILYTVLLNCLALPLLINCLQIFSCPLFQKTTKYKCNSSLHIVFMAASIIGVLYFISIVILNAMFGYYASLKAQSPWAGRNIETAFIKFLKKVIIIILQLAAQRLTLIIILCGAIISDFSIAILLVRNQSYYYNAIQIIEILSAVVPLWWTLCALVSIVCD